MASSKDLIGLNINGVEYVAMGKANSDYTEHSFGLRRVMCGTNYWTSVQAFLVSNRLQQKLHLISLVGFLPQHIQEDLLQAKDKEKEEDTTLLRELAEELMEEDHSPFPEDMVLAASIGNYAGYLAKRVQAKGSVATCCKQDLCSEGEILIEDHSALTDALTKLTALTNLVDRGFLLNADSNVLKRPTLPMAHLVSFGMRIWDSLMCSKNRARRVKFLSLTMQHASGFTYLLGVLAEADPDLREYRCQQGHRLIRTVLPHIARSLFNAFGSNMAKDVTSDARKKLSYPQKRKGAIISDDRPMTSKSVRNHDNYNRRKLTSARKS